MRILCTQKEKKLNCHVELTYFKTLASKKKEEGTANLCVIKKEAAECMQSQRYLLLFLFFSFCFSFTFYFIFCLLQKIDKGVG
jgi:hypothetical protein